MGRETIRPHQDNRRGGIVKHLQDGVGRLAAGRSTPYRASDRTYRPSKAADSSMSMKVLKPSSMKALPAFIGANDHREPTVSDLVRGNPEKQRSLVLDPVEHDSGIFHAARKARHINRCRPRDMETTASRSAPLCPSRTPWSAPMHRRLRSPADTPTSRVTFSRPAD